MLTLLGITALAIVRLASLFAVIMLTGLFSLLSAGLFLTLGAADVALTEAAVGAGITTVLLLAARTFCGPDPIKHHHGNTVPLLVVLLTGSALVYATLDMPDFERADVPAYTHVAPRYITQGPHEVGIPNLVTAVLASYRGYDTLGEAAVVFTAGIAIMLLLGSALPRARPVILELETNPHLREIVGALIPAILLFALYGQFHGDYGPGGGFQAGVIFAAGMILYGLVFGLHRAQTVIPLTGLRLLQSAGLLLYTLVGMASLSKGANYLDYDVLGADPIAGQHVGILLIELGVGVTVMATMLILYYAFAHQNYERLRSE